MIRNRLAELLAERDLKISRVAAQLPNLSRNTITATASNTGKMIQLETVDTLCQFLHIEPTDFFEYLPFNIDFDITITKNEAFFTDVTRDTVHLRDEDIKFDIYIKVNNVSTQSKIFGYLGSNGNGSVGTDIPILLTRDENESAGFADFWHKKITPGFRSIVWDQLKNNLAQAISESLNERLAYEDVSFSLSPKNLILDTDFKSDLLNVDDFGELPF